MIAVYFMTIGARALAEYAANPAQEKGIRNSKAVFIGNEKHDRIGRKSSVLAIITFMLITALLSVFLIYKLN